MIIHMEISACYGSPISERQILFFDDKLIQLTNTQIINNSAFIMNDSNDKKLTEIKSFSFCLLLKRIC